MLVKTKGIVIRHRDIGENDRILTVICEDLGMIEISARGVKKGKSALASACQILCYNEFVIFKGKNNYSLNSADIISQHYIIRQDIVKTALAGYFCEVLKYISPDEITVLEYIKLMLLCLQYLENDKRNLNQIKAIFEFRIVALSGYAPDLVACHNCVCYELDSVYFLPTKGYVLCGDCLPVNNMDNTVTIEIPLVIFKAMQHIMYSDITKLFSFVLNEDAAGFLSEITQSCLFMYVEKTLIKSLDIYIQLCQTL